MVRSNSVLKINDYGFRDLKSSVNTYITAAKSCLEMKETQYREKDFPNSIFDLKVFSTPEIEEIVNFIHENMKNGKPKFFIILFQVRLNNYLINLPI